MDNNNCINHSTQPFLVCRDGAHNFLNLPANYRMVQPIASFLLKAAQSPPSETVSEIFRFMGEPNHRVSCTFITLSAHDRCLDCFAGKGLMKCG